MSTPPPTSHLPPNPYLAPPASHLPPNTSHLTPPTSVPVIHTLLSNPLSGPDIEARSFAIIDAEAGNHGRPAGEWEIVRRMIHTTGDLSLASWVRFTPDAIAAGIAALRAGAPIVADSNMIRSGLSITRLRAISPRYDREHIHCYVADADVAEEAARTGVPRSLFALRKARALLEGGIAVFGNAPVALLELNRLIVEEGLHPALVIGMPVGFVHVEESKDELMRLPVPSIVVAGRRGGSPLAVSALHALCTLAGQPATSETGS